MIVDRLDNGVLYAPLGRRLARALELLREGRIAGQPDGRYEIDGQDLFCLVQRYESQPPEKRSFESHRDYIDVQYIQAGEEVMGHALADTLTVKTRYNADKDITYYETPERYSSVYVREGLFTVFYPNDAHMAGCQVGSPTPVHKVVVKVRVE